jgi:hypothetical protein
LLSCPETIPRVWDLTAAIPRALDELLEAAGEDAATYHAVDVAP